MKRKKRPALTILKVRPIPDSSLFRFYSGIPLYARATVLRVQHTCANRGCSKLVLQGAEVLDIRRNLRSARFDAFSVRFGYCEQCGGIARAQMALLENFEIV